MEGEEWTQENQLEYSRSPCEIDGGLEWGESGRRFRFRIDLEDRANRTC